MRTSFTLNDLCKNPLSKYSHLLKHWELALQCMNLGRTHFSPWQCVLASLTLPDPQGTCTFPKCPPGCGGIRSQLPPSETQLLRSETAHTFWNWEEKKKGVKIYLNSQSDPLLFSSFACWETCENDKAILKCLSFKRAKSSPPRDATSLALPPPQGLSL